ncbi:MAG: hypothetical protein II114_06120 [Treponema sp.]|nr:hypothetical protein [Treponema sp.]
METKYLIERLAKQYESFYLYEEQEIISRINLLKKNFPSVDFLYFVSCNSNENVLKSIFSNGFGASVSSMEELDSVKKMGLGREKIFYSAPGKSMDDLQDSYHECTIVADSISEIERLKYLAEIFNEQIEIAVRINPNFTYEKDQGLPSKFGIDEKEALDYLEKLDELYVRVIGIYTLIKNQELDCSKINRYYKKAFQLAEKVERAVGHKLKFIDLGSGIGIPYTDDDKEINISWLGSEMEERISSFRMTHPRIKIIMELGRYVSGKCGSFVTHVIDVKKSHGKTFAVLQNPLGGFCKPLISYAVKKYSQSENPKSMEPFFTKLNSFEIHPLDSSEETELVTVVGNSFSENDVIAEDVMMPKLRIGEVMVISNAGSYPLVFQRLSSDKEKTAQIFFTVDGEIKGNNE